MNIFRKIKSKSPTILSILAVFGVGATAVTAVMAKPKADERVKRAEKEKGEPLTRLEKIKVAAPAYIPSAAIGFGTSACILAANVLNKRNQAMMTSAYALLHSNYIKYTNKVKELYGTEAHQKILDEVISAEDRYIYTCDWVSTKSLNFDPEDEHELLFYDMMSKRYFKSTPSRVLLAEYHLNRNFVLGMPCSKNDFYNFLGLDPVQYGDDIGWEIFDGSMYWIDLEHYKSYMDNSTLECYVIQPVFGPEPFPVE